MNALHHLTLFMDWEDLILETICSMSSVSPEYAWEVNIAVCRTLLHNVATALVVQPYNTLLASQCFSSYLTLQLVATSATDEHHVN